MEFEPFHHFKKKKLPNVPCVIHAVFTFLGFCYKKKIIFISDEKGQKYLTLDFKLLAALYLQHKIVHMMSGSKDI